MAGRVAAPIGSTLVGEALDTVLFVAIAAALGVFPWESVLSIIVANYIFKVAVEAMFTPMTYRVVTALKRREAVDFFDIGTNFSPFRTGV